MDKVPCHIGIIMDGNRRWAKERGLPVFEGHRKGAERIKEIARHCKKRGVRTLTLYAFSTENWGRAAKEVNFLMRLGGLLLGKELGELHREGAKLLVIGQKERLTVSLQKKIEKAEDLTRGNSGLNLNVAISYSGWAEIIEAIRRIAQEKTPPEEINQELVRKYLWTAGIPDADLIIRTSGEQRISDFLTWEASYAELYFCQKYWPDFSERDLDEALEEYGRRQRRYGK